MPNSPASQKLNAMSKSVARQCDALVQTLEALAREAKRHDDVRGPTAEAVSSFAQQVQAARSETFGWGGLSYMDQSEYDRLRQADYDRRR